MSSIDAHVHVWGDDQTAFPFSPLGGLLTPDEPFPVDRLESAMGAVDVGRALAIQPRVYGYDHSYLFAAAEQMPARLRVMPLIDLETPAPYEAAKRLTEHPRVAGFRVIVLQDQEAKALQDPRRDDLWRYLVNRGLPVGLLIEPQYLHAIVDLTARHPELRVVVDHLGRIPGDEWPTWQRDILALAAIPGVFIKLSALGHLSSKPFPYSDMARPVNSVLDAFGCDRLLWGSDWPHVYNYGQYADSLQAIQALTPLTASELHQLTAGTTQSVFGFSARPLDTMTRCNNRQHNQEGKVT